MNPVIIACRAIENELWAAMTRTGCKYKILWLESGLHNWPQILNHRLQILLDSCHGYDTVLLAMSLCGNSVLGLHTGNFQLVIPRCDDCITLLLGSTQKRQTLPATYFLTEGWLRGERNLWAEYCYCQNKYGKPRARRIFSGMLAHYRHLALVDTGCFHRDTVATQVQRIAGELGLAYTCVEGTLDYLTQLLTMQWQEDRFVIVPPHSTATAALCSRRDNNL